MCDGGFNCGEIDGAYSSRGINKVRFGEAAETNTRDAYALQHVPAFSPRQVCSVATFCAEDSARYNRLSPDSPYVAVMSAVGSGNSSRWIVSRSIEKSDRLAGQQRCFNGQIREGRGMQRRSKTGVRSLNTRTRVRSGVRSGRIRQKRGLYPQKEAAYWRKRHSKQPYAKNYSYQEFRHAYRTGYDTFFKYPGKKFDEVEESVATEYENAKPASALPWDIARPAVNAVWEKMAGVIGPRDPDRGIRGSI